MAEKTLDESPLESFFRGLTEPSWTALVTTLGVALAWAAVASLTLTPDRFGRDAERSFWARDSADFYFFATTKALALGAEPPQASSVVLLSNSSHLFALPVESEVAEALGRAAGRRVEFHRLAAGALTYWEMRALVEAAAPGIGGVVVIGVGPPFLVAGPDLMRRVLALPRLGIASRAFDEEVRRLGFEPPHRAGNFFVDNHAFFVARAPFLVANLLRRRMWADWSESRRRVALEARERIETTTRQRLRELRALEKANLEVLGRLLAQLRRAGAREIILLEMLRQPSTDVYAEIDVRAYTETMAAFAARESLRYFSLDREAHLVDEDFQDYTHLGRRDAVRRYREALARRLGPRIVAAATGEDGP